MKILLMCDGQVGDRIACWLLDNYPEDVGAIVTISENATRIAAHAKNIPTLIYQSEAQIAAALTALPKCNLGLLAWWPKLVSKKIIALTEYGFINTHPSLLPHNRGKHYNFWVLVEQAPFGVSLHYVDEGIDSGDIVAQSPLAYGWEDTGETLYAKALQATFDLFKKTYPQLRVQGLPRFKQDLSQGSLHYAKEIDLASQIDLDKSYRARDLINLLRARTFPGHPACIFHEDEVAYEISIKIKRKSV